MDETALEKIIYNECKHKSFFDVYRAYIKSNGVTKKIIGNALADKLTDKEVLISYDNLLDILDNAKVETLWNLCVSAKNEIVKNESFIRLEHYIENSENIELEKKKMRKKDVKKIFGGKK